MAFPNTIDAGNVSATQGTSLPVQVGDNLYVLLEDKIAQIVVAYKSTDHGVTWTVMDAANGPLAFQVYGAALAGTVLWCINNDDANTGNLSAQPFNTATDMWGANIVSALGGGQIPLPTYFRASDSTILIASTAFATAPAPGRQRIGYATFDTVGLAFGPAFIPIGETNPAVAESFKPFFWVKGNGCTHLLMLEVDSDGAGPNSHMEQQALVDNGTLGTLQVVDVATNTAPPDNPTGVGNGTDIVIGWTPDNVTGQIAHTFKGASSSGVIAFVETDLDRGANEFCPGDALAFVANGANFYALIDAVLSPAFTDYTFSSYTDSGSGFGTPTIEGTTSTIAFTGSRYACALSFAAWGILLEASSYFWSAGSAPPPPVTATPKKPSGGGGTFFPRFINKSLLVDQIQRGPSFRWYAPLYWLFDYPNAFDVCLSREWRLYNEIDPKALTCASKPNCFSGESGARPWVEPPPGAVTFNPDKAIPLPAPAVVNAVILSFRVPIAYDGIILAQYHAYRGAGAFVEASGDLVWRVRVDGRYLRDMGDMEVSIGSPQTLSPCPGGLWIQSGNLVEYVVSAPNGSGSLPLPGQGNILAGLQGWFWPRV